MTCSVVFEDVTKVYRMKKGNAAKLKSLFQPETTKGQDVHYALKNISLSIPKGEVVGIIGKNGSGKSTFANLLIGATQPTEGDIKIEGVVSLIAVSSGLNYELTGRENIELKSLMMGLSRSEIKAIEKSVLEFSELGKFIDQPVKSYSSGMKSRLGFAISVNIDPDILVVDEALSVGDQSFYKKCLMKFEEFKNKNKTIFFVSHSMSQVSGFCQTAIWLHEGELKSYGPCREVIQKYQNHLNSAEAVIEGE